MFKKLSIGVDVGANKILGIVFDGNKILQRAEYKYPRKPKTRVEFSSALFGVIDNLLNKVPRKNLIGIGLGFPGIVANDGKILLAANLKAIEKIDWRKLLQNKYKSKIAITNDAKAAVWAEYILGAGKNSESSFVFTIGSGVGSGFIKYGKIQSGAFSSAYEAGHLILDIEKTLYSKKKMDFEEFDSAKFFLTRGINPMKAEALARKGNKKMIKLWQEFGVNLGIGIANIVNLLEPEKIIIAGGIAHAWPLFAPSAKSTAKRFIISPAAKNKIKILRGKFYRDAGAIGAALMATK